MKEISNTKSWLFLIGANFIWSLQFMFVKLLQLELGALFIVWLTVFGACLLLIPIVFKTYTLKTLPKYNLKIFVPLTLFGALPAQLFATYGTQFSMASNASIIFLTLPIVTAILGFVFLKEKMTFYKWISFGLSITGVVICSLGDFENADFGNKFFWGNVLIFASVLGSAYYNTFCKSISNAYTDVVLLFYASVTLVMVLTPLVFIFDYNSFAFIPNFNLSTILSLIALTVFHNFLSMLLLFKAMQKIEVIYIGLSNYLIPVFGISAAALILHENINGNFIIGAGLVLGGTLITTLLEYNIVLPSNKNKL